MKTYKIGMLGFGFISKVHAFGYQNLHYYYDLPFRTQLCGICARSESTLQKAKQYGFTILTHEPEELINHPDIDIIDIATPNIFHKQQLLQTIKAKKPVYCEKPVVSTLEETFDIEKALLNYDKANQVVFHNRFFPAMIKTKSLLQKNLLGKIIHFRFAYYHSGSLEKEKPLGWKQEKGAGVLLDLGSHIIDLAYWFLGEFESVAGQTRILYPERITKEGKKVSVEADDYVLAQAKMKNGSTGTIEASKITVGSQDELIFEIYGTEGAVKYNSTNPNFLLALTGKDKGFTALPTVQRYEEGKQFPGPKFSIGWMRAHTHSIYYFLTNLHEGKDASPSLRDGIYNMKVCQAIRNSERTGNYFSPSSQPSPARGGL